MAPDESQGWTLREVVGEFGGVGGEVALEVDVGPKGDNGDLARGSASEVVDHGGEAAHVVELADGVARALDDYDE